MIPRRIPLALLPLCALLAGCGSSRTTSTPDSGVARDGGSAGDDYLRKSNLVNARFAYEAQVAATPADSHSAFGAALTELLLLPDDPAVTGLLDQCEQIRFDVANKIFGPQGALAQDQKVRAGTAALTAATRQGQSGNLTPAHFAPETVRTSVFGDHHLSLRIKDADLGGDGSHSAELDLETSYANVAAYGLPLTPLTDQLSVAAQDFGGLVSFMLPRAGGLVWDTYDTPVSGFITFHKVGSGALGDEVVVEFKDVVLEGHPHGCDPCTADDWPYLYVNGSVTDTITAPVQVTLPLSNLKDDAGPPHRSSLVVLAEGCAGLDAEQLRLALGALMGSLEQIIGNLARVLSDPNAETFQFRVPGGLFFVDGEIPLNITDVRAFKAILDFVDALGSGVTQYRTLVHRFEELIGNYDLWVDSTSGPTSTAERGFVASLLTTELNDVFLGREPGFDLDKARTALNTALNDATAAVTREPKNTGILDFQTANSRDFAADLAAQTSFLRTSLASTDSQAFPHSPDWRISLGKIFDVPLDVDGLHRASTDGHGIFVLRAGVPGSPYASDRNDSMQVDAPGVRRAWAPYLQEPADLSQQTCNLQTACPGRYRCQLDGPGTQGYCLPPDFLFLDKASEQRALPASGTPAFFNGIAVRPLAVLQ